MSYLNKTLTITGSQIYYIDEGQKCEVMMDWEDEIMSASAAYVCQNGGDILEIGFGMGISAGYIQSHSINSHTIIENHPDVIPKAQAWAQGKPNVTIITGSWYDIKNDLSTYDGLKTSQKLDMLTKEKGLPVKDHNRIWNDKQKFTLEALSNLEINSNLLSTIFLIN